MDVIQIIKKLTLETFSLSKNKDNFAEMIRVTNVSKKGMRLWKIAMKIKSIKIQV